jgi:hypothetical protein
MLIGFPDKTDIDLLVELANTQLGGHEAEWLTIPERHPEWNKLVNDTLSEDDSDPVTTLLPSPSELRAFNIQGPGQRTQAIVAVDSGVVDLGELAGGGTVFAIRGAAACYPGAGSRPMIYTYNTGAIVIDPRNQYPVFHFIGRRLGRDDIFVSFSEEGDIYAHTRESMLENPNQIQDRCRNFVERLIQEEAIGILSEYGGGILLIDGALPAGTFDTPQSYLEDMLRKCRLHGINVAALSKKTRITVGDIPIRSLFADDPTFIGYAPLTEILAAEREPLEGEDQVGRSVTALTLADDIFAVRFGYGPTSMTFRVDLHPSVGLKSSNILDQLFTCCPIYGGYPRPLIDAHQFSSFMYQDIQNLIADVVVRLGVRPEERQSMEVLFQPFGGGFK